MKVAMIGLNKIEASNLEYDFPMSGTELIICSNSQLSHEAENYAASSGLKITCVGTSEAYSQIIDKADGVMIFWDGRDRDILSAIEYCRTQRKPCTIKSIEK